MNHLKLIGARIKSELNDIKRTPEAAATELGLDYSFVESVVSGNCNSEDQIKLIALMGNVYPIDPSDLMLLEDDTQSGVKIMRASDSKASSRIFNRPDRTGERTPYYDYRDTATSPISPIKPEWIKELRVVNNSDPNNPDVVYNNGHFMHQMTFFIGPVNFYYEIDGKKHCVEMNTGDSNYITPFHPHSFTSRNKDETALIMAVTFGSGVRRAQKELYLLGQRGIDGFGLDYRNHTRAATQLIRQHMSNEHLTPDTLSKIVEEGGLDIDVAALLDEGVEKSQQDLEALANLLSVEFSDLILPVHNPNEEIVVKHHSSDESYMFPGEAKPFYKINPLARTSKMPELKAHDIQVLGTVPSIQYGFKSSLHTFVYSYGDADMKVLWETSCSIREKILHPGDSMYIQPFVAHAYANISKGDSRLISVGVGGAISLATQIELSQFSDPSRAALETMKWFD